jgi:spore coat protein U-like protein
MKDGFQRRRGHDSHRVLFAALLVAMLVSAGRPRAQSLGGTLDASLTLVTSCVITGDTATSGADFGVLDFGSRPATFVGQLTTVATGGAGGPGTTELTCSPDVTSIAISVDAGLNAGQGTSIGSGARALASGVPGYVPYDVFADVSHSTQYPISGTSVPFTVPSPGASFALPIYGLINKTSAAALSAGVYTDTLTVTITF